MLETTGLAKRYGDFAAVDHLDLRVAKGEIFAFLGPNGAGKTTTIKMLMGLLQPSGGEARIDSFDCFKERVEVMRRVGYLPDDPIFYDYLRGDETIRFVGEMQGLSRDEIDEIARPLLARLDFGEALNDYAANYSRGMKKKLGMVCALIHDPDLIILDEPTSGLDPHASRVLQEIIRERKNAGKTVFFSTHLLDQAEKLCDKVGILFKGKLAACGTLPELSASLVAGGDLEEIFFAVTSPGESGSPENDGGTS